jgi:3-deoxy-D-manno-octulosonic-acid transferase
MVKAVFFVYDLVWSLAIPFLHLNRRLAEGYHQRRFRQQIPSPADIWIQAASVGEAFLAWELLKQLPLNNSFKILVTTNTRQGMDILNQAIPDLSTTQPDISVCAAYFPFDKPGIMKRAVNHIRPRIMILLESEMWPAHLAALKAAGCPVIVVNGRMTEKSLRGYQRWPQFWHQLRPDKILAISDEDALRFGRLFGPERVAVMSNIKFDRLDLSSKSSTSDNPLSALFTPESPLIVLGSVRGPEEEPIQKIILEIRNRCPEMTIGLFPRHFERLEAWTSFFTGHHIPVHRRSGIDRPVAPGTVVLWDVYGELTHAYHIATAAFVGGTLAPLGGQNFLEPLTAGIRPVIGPSWENFHWVGTELIDQELVRVASDWHAAAETLIKDIENPMPKDRVKKEVNRYIQKRRGGTASACRLVEGYLG